MDSAAHLAGGSRRCSVCSKATAKGRTRGRRQQLAPSKRQLPCLLASDGYACYGDPTFPPRGAAAPSPVPCGAGRAAVHAVAGSGGQTRSARAAGGVQHPGVHWSPPTVGSSTESHTHDVSDAPKSACIESSTKTALPGGASLPANLLLDSQGLFRSQNNQELLQRAPLDCFYLDFGVAAETKANSRSPTVGHSRVGRSPGLSGAAPRSRQDGGST